MAQQREWSGFEIAVIGVAGRFPGAPDIDTLWHNLEQGVESIRFLSLDELERHGRSAEALRGKSFVPAHGVLDDFDRFDAEFFGFRAAEAEVLDPQHRIFLEVAWEALENAGYDPTRYRGLIGVFAGSSADHYLYENVRRNAAAMGRVGAFQASYSNLMDHLATRVSYKLDLLGPSFTIQSACSTSLVAAHVACQQLLVGACDIALAGGVSLTLPSECGIRVPGRHDPLARRALPGLRRRRPRMPEGRWRGCRGPQAAGRRARGGRSHRGSHPRLRHEQRRRRQGRLYSARASRARPA